MIASASCSSGDKAESLLSDTAAGEATSELQSRAGIRALAAAEKVAGSSRGRFMAGDIRRAQDSAAGAGVVTHGCKNTRLRYRAW